MGLCSTPHTASAISTPKGPDIYAGLMSSSQATRRRISVPERSTYRSVGRLYRPSYLQTQSAEGEQEQEPSALRLLDLLFAHPVIIVVGRHDLLKQRVDLGRHAGRDDGGRSVVYEFYVRSAFGVRSSAHQCVAAKGYEFRSWPGTGRSVDFRRR
jgi:hypothetical protein